MALHNLKLKLIALYISGCFCKTQCTLSTRPYLNRNYIFYSYDHIAIVIRNTAACTMDVICIAI